MKRIAFFGFFLFILNIADARAGFQWMPPKEGQPPPLVESAPAVMPPPANYQMLPPPLPAPAPMAAVPAQPVMTEPLMPMPPVSAPMPAPMSENIMPPPYIGAPVAPPVMGGSLVIDPYPLREQSAGMAKMEIAESSVQQAMIEESHLLRPLQLGAGMKTGAQAKRAIVPSGYGIGSRDMTSTDMTYPQGVPAGLTPMVGGEPPPLPGTPRKPSSQAVSSSQLQAPMPLVPTQSYNYAEAIGFGKQLPLALALSQVIPPEYTHSYAVGVNPGISVDWEGGKPWNQVLDEMLRPHNLNASIQGSQVVIAPMATL